MPRGRSATVAVPPDSAAEHSYRMVNKSIFRHALHLLFCAALPTVGACTDPTAIGPQPEFIRLGRISSFDGYDGPGQITPLARDSCPTIPSAPSNWTRKALGDEPATVALPPAMLGRSAGFGSSQGIVFNDPDGGIVALAYGDEQPLLANSFYPRGRIPVYGFNRSCSISVGGRPATIILSYSVLEGTGGGRSIVYDPVAIIRATSPTSRRINAIIVLNTNTIDPSRGVAAYTAAFLSLASVVTSLQW